MIKKYYDPIKNSYVDVIHIDNDKHDVSIHDIRRCLDDIVKTDVKQSKDKESYFVSIIGNVNPYRCNSFTFCPDDYVIFDRKNKSIEILMNASSEINDFFDNYLEV